MQNFQCAGFPGRQKLKLLASWTPERKIKLKGSPGLRIELKSANITSGKLQLRIELNHHVVTVSLSHKINTARFVTLVNVATCRGIIH